MNVQQVTVAEKCEEASERDAMTFPEIVGTLMQSGFESYHVDFRRRTATYFLPNGECVEFKMHQANTPIAGSLDEAALGSAIREAQNLVSGYTYRGFCEKAGAAGCAGYMVSFSGKSAVYFGRTGETHVEYFPGSRP